MAKIKLKKNYIGIPIVDENDRTVYEVKFLMTDENIQKIYEQSEDLEELIEVAENEDYQSAKDFCEVAIDGLFGEGTFNELYQLSESLIITVEYFAEIVLIIRDELSKTKALELQDYVSEEYGLNTNETDQGA